MPATVTTSASVLIVEDEQGAAKALQDTLADLGYGTSMIASSGDEAIHAASTRCPDVVLMDVQIKGEHDGVETAEILHRRFDVPIVYLTGLADEATLARAQNSEPYAYLVKPVKSSSLRSAIEIALCRHKMERRLRERERWFSTVVRSIADAIVAVDLAGNITLLNPAAEFLLGRKLEDVVGRPAREVLRMQGADTPEGQLLLDRALTERRPISVPEDTLIDAGNSPHVVSDSVAPVLDQEQLLGAVMVLRDVTEQKRVQSQLELTDRLASLGTMAAGVAHEINNPLAVVMGSASLLLEQLEGSRRLSTDADGTTEVSISDFDRAVQSVTEIDAAAKRIANIIRDLITFARPAQRSSSDADVRRTVEWAVRTTAHEFRHRARVVVDIGNVAPAHIDETRLGQVLVNVLVNAAHAIEPGDFARKEVSIRARLERPDRILIEVRDSGCGMSPDVKKRVFEPFFTTRPVGSGMGVGLSVSRGIVVSAGGSIDVESEVGKGSVFRIVLPRAGEKETATPEQVATAPRPTRGRILAVDDEDAVLRIVRRILTEHELVCATDAREALDAIQRGERFDLILCDVMMPDVTGIDFYESLLERDPVLASKVLFMTGGATTPKVAAFLDSVPRPHILKPFSAEQLRSEVQRLLDRDKTA